MVVIQFRAADFQVRQQNITRGVNMFKNKCIITFFTSRTQERNISHSGKLYELEFRADPRSFLHCGWTYYVFFSYWCVHLWHNHRQSHNSTTGSSFLCHLSKLETNLVSEQNRPGMYPRCNRWLCAKQISTYCEYIVSRLNMRQLAKC